MSSKTNSVHNSPEKESQVTKEPIEHSSTKDVEMSSAKLKPFKSLEAEILEESSNRLNSNNKSDSKSGLHLESSLTDQYDSSGSSNDIEQKRGLKRGLQMDLKDDSSDDGMSEKSFDAGVMYYLVVSNLPKCWSYVQIQDFIGKTYGTVKKINMKRDKDLNFTGTVKIEFDYFVDCNNAKNSLAEKVVEGRNIYATITIPGQEDSDRESSEPQEKRSKTSFSEGRRFPDRNEWFGLKMDYLQSLGITPPFGKWVHVSNFRCDKPDLREVLELAGHVLVINVNFKATPRYAKVMYSHPLEAVQAVSMLNNQVLYNQTLTVRIDNVEQDAVLLPSGLQSIGRGMGLKGEPVRNFAIEYQRFVDGQSTRIDSSLFAGAPCQNSEEKFKPRFPPHLNHAHQQHHSNHQQFIPVRNSSPMPHVLANRPIAPRPFAPVQPAIPTVPQVPFQQRPFLQDPGFRAGQIRPQLGVPRPMSDPSLMANSVPQLCPNSFTVELNNLPLSTTFPMLCEKMSHCGQVLSLQLTGPGCARVQFANRMQAERCFQQYDKCCVLGNIIAVRFV